MIHGAAAAREQNTHFAYTCLSSLFQTHSSKLPRMATNVTQNQQRHKKMQELPAFSLTDDAGVAMVVKDGAAAAIVRADAQKAAAAAAAAASASAAQTPSGVSGAASSAESSPRQPDTTTATTAVTRPSASATTDAIVAVLANSEAADEAGRTPRDNIPDGSSSDATVKAEPVSVVDGPPGDQTRSSGAETRTQEEGHSAKFERLRRECVNYKTTIFCCLLFAVVVIIVIFAKSG